MFKNIEVTGQTYSSVDTYAELQVGDLVYTINFITGTTKMFRIDANGSIGWDIHVTSAF